MSTSPATDDGVAIVVEVSKILSAMKPSEASGPQLQLPTVVRTPQDVIDVLVRMNDQRLALESALTAERQQHKQLQEQLQAQSDASAVRPRRDELESVAIQIESQRVTLETIQANVSAVREDCAKMKTETRLLSSRLHSVEDRPLRAFLAVLMCFGVYGVGTTMNQMVDQVVRLAVYR